MTALPCPLTPPECDLRDFQFMPVDIARLFGSDFHSHSTDAEWRAGMTLWLKSYHQVPAASMPDDDVSLARAAEFGTQIKSWRKVRGKALRGWTKCSDGRLYHPVVAEKALEGWIEKLRARKSSAAGNAKRHGYDFDPATHDAAIETACEMLARLNPNSRSLKHRTPASVPPGEKNYPTGIPDDVPPGSQGTLKGQVRDKERLASEFDSFFAVFPKQEQRDNAEREFAKALDGGATAAELLDGAKRFAAHVEREKIPLRFTPLAKTWLADGCWKDRYGQAEGELVLPDLDPSWPPEEVKRWSKNLGEVNFRTYFGPAQFIDCEPRILRYRSTTLRGLAEGHFPQVAKEVALEVAA